MRDALQTGCLAVGVLCFFYYIGIVCYAGIHTSLVWVWLFGGVMLLFLNRALAYQRIHAQTYLRYVSAALLVLILFGLLVMAVFGSRIVRGMTQKARPGLDYVIVLGAQVKGTAPSRALRRRLDRAAQYAQENPDTVFVLSGGKGADEEISEAECMYRYLTEKKGMDASRLKKEDRSTSTRENLQFSARLIDPQKSVGIVSNDFHIYRALKLARELNYPDVSGIPASSDPGMQPHNIMREVCCLLADVFHIRM